MLSDDERREVLKVAREAASPNKVLIAGTGIESASETLRLTEYAAELGYDAALVRTPHFYKKMMQPANLLAFYRTVADRSPLPVLIYNVPSFTGYDMPAEVVIELAGHPNIIGIKESGGDVEKIRRMAEATRHVKRAATVTETFDAVTPRMLKGVQRKQRTGRGTCAGCGTGRRQTIVCCGERGERDEDKAEGSRFPDIGRPGAETGTFVAGWRGGWSARFRSRGSHGVLRDLRCLEGRRR